MKAEEVQSYAAGNRDFSGADLRGQNFKGQNLSGANFSHADIRGANFSQANLSGANFTGAKAGLRKHWMIAQLLLVLLISVLAGVLQRNFGYFLAFSLPSLWSPDPSWQFTQDVGLTAIYLITIVATFFVMIRQSLAFKTFIRVAALAIVAFAFAFIAAIGVFAAFALLWVSAFAGVSSAASAASGAVIASMVAVTVAVTVAYAVTVAVPLAVAVTVSGAYAGAFAVTLTLAVTADAATGIAASAVTVAVPLVGTGVVAFAALLLGLHVARGVNRGDQKLAAVRIMGVAFGAIGGTSFYKADLTEANFTNAALKSTHLRQTNLTRTCWKDAQIDRARVGKSILADAKVRSLLVTRNGYKKSFVDADFSGANLDGMNLNEANLKGADFHRASLRQADLRGANLTGVQAIETDFTGAAITGACLEAWNIDHTTMLENIDCQFVFLLENANERGDRERRPLDPSQLLQPGEFERQFRSYFADRPQKSAEG